jgi:hypothetical protein
MRSENTGSDYLSEKGYKRSILMNRVTPFRENENNGKSRSMSFNSSVFFTGIFPKKVDVLLPVINVLLLFKIIPSVVILEDACKKLIQFNRFLSAVKHNGKEWQFVEVEVDFSNHIHTVEVSSEKGVMEETDRIAQNGVGDYDGKKPLWNFHRIDNKGTGLSGLLIRVHHAIGEGFSVVNALSKILTDEHGVPLNFEEMNVIKKKEQQFSYSFRQKLKSFFQILYIPISRFDSRTLFSPKIITTKKRRTIIFPAVRLEFIKSIKNTANVTVSDVLLSAVTGAIRRYCDSRQDTAMQLKTLKIRCLMPVLLPRSSEQLALDPSNALNNNWVMVSVPIPLASSSAKERLHQCHITTLEVLESPTSGVQMRIQQILPNLLPTFLQQKTVFDIFTRHTMSFSNVPGPNKVSFLGGERVEGIQVFFPNHLPSAIVVSYAGGLYLNINMDDDDLPGAAEDLPRFYTEELNELASAFAVDTEFMLTQKSLDGYFSISTNG